MESANEQLIASVVGDGRPRNARHIVIASPSTAGSATVINMPGRQLDDLAFADSERVLLVSSGNEVLRFELNDLGVPTGRYRLPEPRSVGGLALTGEGARFAADSGAVSGTLRQLFTRS